MRCTHCMKEINEKSEYCPFCDKAVSEPNPPHRLAAGTLLNNRYLVGNTLGEGGFGITYVGYDQTLDIKIAIKEYFPSGCATRNNTISNEVTLNISRQKEYYKNGKERFLQEARSIARFSKERGIVDVRDFFTENNTAYIVMEFLEGTTLMQHLREEGIFPPGELLDMMLPLMHTLEKMHKAGIIHRDISPDNIMMESDGSLKLLDFGAARYFAGEETKSLSVVLRPGYAPYEQYSRKGEQGSWTDVYALCATIYKCITGVTPPDALDRCMEDTIESPIELNFILSPHINAAIMRGLAVYPQKRIRTVGELINLIYTEPSPKSETDFKNLTVEKSETDLKNLTVEKSKTDFINHTVEKSNNVTENKTVPIEPTVSEEISDLTKVADPDELTPEEPTTEEIGSTDTGYADANKETEAPESKDKSREKSRNKNRDENGKKPKKKKLVPVIIAAAAAIAAAAIITVFVLKPGGTDADLSDKIKAAADESKTFSCSSNRIITIGSDKKASLYFFENGNTENVSDTLKDGENLIAVESSDGDFLGLKADGIVSLLYGSVSYESKLSSWKNITAFSAGRGFIIGLKNDGTVLAEGESPSEKVKPLNVSEWSGITDISADWVSLGLKADGTVMSTDYTDEFKTWSDISALSHDRTYLAVKKNGTVAFRNNICPDKWKEAEGWTNIIEVSAQGTSENDHIVGLTADGTVTATGNNDSGQCEVSEWKDITAVHAAKGFTVGKKSDGTYVIATNDSKLKESFEKTVNSK